MKKQPPEDLTQQQILDFLNARVEEERARLLERLQRPRSVLNLQPGPCNVQLQLAPMLRWRCGHLVKAVRGYITHAAFHLLLGYGGEAAEVVLYAFDLLMFRGKDVRLWPLEERRGRLFERGQMGMSTASLT